MKTPLFASGVTQNSRSRSKSAYDAAVSKKPVPESAATAPSANCQFASPTCVQPERLLPSNSVRHSPPGAGSAPCSTSGCSPDVEQGAEPAPGGEWRTLFDGSSLSGWTQVGDANWQLADGAVAADSGTGFLLT